MAEYLDTTTTFYALMLEGSTGYVLAAVWGAIWGSFLNVCIHRIPKGLSIVSPPSSCPSCGNRIMAIDNIPILSWLILRGRCRHCSTPISPRYPIVEGLTALLSIAIFHAALSARLPDAPISAVLATYLASFAFSAALIVISFIDLDHLIIPDVISYPGMVIALLYSLLPGGITPVESMIGLAVGAGSLLLLIHGYSLIRGIHGMGYGDVKLLAMIGAFLGYTPLLFVAFAAALQGVVAAGILAAARRLGIRNLPLYDPSLLQEDIVETEEEKSEERDQPSIEATGHGDSAEEEEEEEKEKLSILHLAIPFGPFLALAAIEYILVGDLVVETYLRFMENLVERILGI